MSDEEYLERQLPQQREDEAVSFFDDALVYWKVSERDARLDPGARGERCLIFATSEMLRRVWRYPVAWRELSVEALIALSWQR